MFEQIAGLPLHPLVVHAVVVLVPLSTLGALAVAIRPVWGRAYGPLVAVGALAAAVSAFVAARAGEALLLELGFGGEAAAQIEQHQQWGNLVVISGSVFAVLAVATAVLARLDGAASRYRRPVAWLAVVAGVVATVLTVLAGDSGSRSAWGYVFGG